MALMIPNCLIAQDVVPQAVLPKVYTKAELIDKVYTYAEQYDVSPKTMISIINCENTNWDPTLQSRIVNKKGIREESYGLSQIYLPAHPNITKENAIDPDFSLDFMANNLAEKNGNIWTCYRFKNNS